ncbi:DUF6094 domain-containing protein [Hahella ganghwensis]|uniref:DUF6094 domain-containing protein n=1 Tax=Hahella ganghwensis TaxID=286420 RepID=UPI00035F2D32|nr:DUF6094 domain-containing protein [Hahella ganghwensis]
MALMHPRVVHNYIKNGFYPTDDESLLRLGRMVNSRSEGSVHLLDPCCGEGVALQHLTGVLERDGRKVESYGIEIDEERAWQAKTRVSVCLHADLQDTLVSPRSFSLLFLNPPYGDRTSDHHNKDIRKNEASRLEEYFLNRCQSLLMYGGVLIYVVPHYSLKSKTICNLIAKSYQKVGIFRLPEQQFKQVVVVGYRSRPGTICKEVQKQLLKVGENIVNADELPEQPEYFYEVPTVTSNSKKFMKLTLDQHQLIEQIDAHKGLWRQFDMLYRPVVKSEFRPLCRLSKWHLAISLAAGEINGLVCKSTGEKLLIKGDTFKVSKERVTSSVDEETGKQTTTRVLTDQFVPVIRAIDLTENSDTYGEILTIK